MNREWIRTNLSAMRIFFKRRQMIREIRLEATVVAFVEDGRHTPEI
jgi:hypothetical protein